MTTRIFISYARRDAEAFAQLKCALDPVLMGRARIFSDHDLRVGDRFLDRLNEECQAADVIVFLVSKAFLESDFCTTVELIWGMDQANRQTSCLVPVILEPCDWRKTRLKHFYAAPENGRSIAAFPSQRDGYAAAAACVLQATDPRTAILWTGPSGLVTKTWLAEPGIELSADLGSVGDLGLGWKLDGHEALPHLNQDIDVDGGLAGSHQGFDALHDDPAANDDLDGGDDTS